MTLWQRFSDFTSRLCAPAQDFEPDRSASGGIAANGNAQHSANFTMAVIALSAKMAKADGVVVPVEIAAFNRLFQPSPSEQPNVDYIFSIAKSDTAGFEAYASQIQTLLGGDTATLSDVLSSLFHIATADRALHPHEDAFLKVVAERFQLSAATYRHIRAQFVHDETSPYDVLGLSPSDDNATIRSRHRRLVREHHPDVLMGRGLPAALIEIATRKLAAINGAFDVIARERGL